jgi:hypothetical protein
MKILLLSMAIIVSACQLQSNAPLAPTVTIPPKIEQVAAPEPSKPVNPLAGIWKSNTELTLASLNQIDGISEDSREYLKQNVFGLLTREFTDSQTRAYFGRNKDGEEATAFGPYRILELTDAKIKVEHTDPLTGKIISSVFYLDNRYLDNDCYYELVSKWQYKEYFCREEGEKKKFIAIPKSNQNQLQ